MKWTWHKRKSTENNTQGFQHFRKFFESLKQYPLRLFKQQEKRAETKELLLGKQKKPTSQINSSELDTNQAAKAWSLEVKTSTGERSTEKADATTATRNAGV